jgi:hypothetical protein
MLPYEGLGMSLVILALVTAPLLCLGIFYYLKKRLEHQQILMAIEKGVPLSKILPPPPGPASPVWIKYVSLGIAAIILACGILINEWVAGDVEVVAAFAICGFGAYWIVRGLLNYRYASPRAASRTGAAVKPGPAAETSISPSASSQPPANT